MPKLLVADVFPDYAFALCLCETREEPSGWIYGVQMVRFQLQGIYKHCALAIAIQTFVEAAAAPVRYPNLAANIADGDLRRSTNPDLSC